MTPNAPPARRDRVRPSAFHQPPPARELAGVLRNGLGRVDRGLPIKSSVRQRLIEMGYMRDAGKNGWRSVLTSAGRKALRNVGEPS